MKFVRGSAFSAHLKLAGETALSHLTELASPRIDTFAVAASDWKAISQTADLIETDRDEADCSHRDMVLRSGRLVRHKHRGQQ